MATLQEFKRTILDPMIFDRFEKSLVYGALCNREFEGRLGAGVLQYGETVKILEIQDFDAVSYTGSTITYLDIDDAASELKIDTANYIAVAQNELEKTFNNSQLTAKLAQKIAQGLGDAVDQAVAAQYAYAGSTEGNDTTAIALTSSNVTTYIALAIQALREYNVPANVRIACVAPPWFFSKTLLAAITKDTDNTNVLYRTNYIGTYLNVDLYMSNNIQRKSGETGGNFNKIMFFIPGETIALAHNLGEFTYITSAQDQTGFSDKWKQMQYYGIKTVRPTSLHCLTATETAEA